MSKLISDSEIARLAELLPKISQDWELDGNGYDVFGDSTAVRVVDPVGMAAEIANARFAVEAQYLVPRLLDSVRRLKEALAIALKHDCYEAAVEVGCSAKHDSDGKCWACRDDAELARIRSLMGDE